MEDRKIEGHPSYGMVGISHVSGTAVLFGSEFTHRNYLVLTIRHAERHRSNAKDWYFGKEEIVSVAMSESQFVELVGRTNIGDGVPCTIEHILGKRVPEPPKPEPIKSRFVSDMEADIEKCVKDLGAAHDALLEAIESGKIGKTVLREIAKQLQYAKASVDRGIPFVRRNFEEEMEAITNHAAVEIEATVSSIAMRLGLDSMLQIGATGPKLIVSGDGDQGA